MKKTTLLSLVVLASAANAQLYGVGRSAGGYDFYQVNTTTGAATSLFTFSVPNAGSLVGLTYVPSSNKFLTSAQYSAFSSGLVEIDATAMTATVVSHGIPNGSSSTPYFEGLEYMASMGGVVVSYGPGGFFSGNLALLNTSGYGLLNNNAATGIPDGDVIFMDGTGALNVMDTNNPYSGNMRNRITSPFSGIGITPWGSNMFSATDSDFAWKQDEGRLFLTQGGNLATVNAASTTITFVGSYGVATSGAPINITGLATKPVPEPATLAALGIGATALMRRRLKK